MHIQEYWKGARIFHTRGGFPHRGSGQEAIILFLVFLLTACQSTGHKALIRQLTPEQKVRLLIGSGQGSDNEDKNRQMMASAANAVPGSAAATYPVPELHIPSLIYADGPAGLRIAPRRSATDSTFFCTGFPIGESLAATWDADLQEEVGRAMGNEVLEYGVDVLLAPGINLMRNPLCGRNFEYYSEDPILSGRTAAAVIRGVQTNGVGCAVKHFAANNQELNRCSSDSRVGTRTLRELYLRNFEVAIREGQPWTVMTAYNYINGQHASQSRELTENILRGEWGYKGLVMTDWGSGTDPVAQIHAGNDNIMPGGRSTFAKISDALRDGRLSPSDVERSVERMLTLIDKTPKARGYRPSQHPDLAGHARIARQAGAEGCVLLKNDGALPLAPESRIALYGVTSYETIAGGTGAGDVNKAYVINLDQGLKEAGFALSVPVAEAYAAHIAAENERLAPINKKRGWWYGAQLKDELPLIDTLSTLRSATQGDTCQSKNSQLSTLNSQLSTLNSQLSSLLPLSALENDAAVITIGRRSGEGNDRALEGDYQLKSQELALISEVCSAFHAQGKKVTVVLNVCGPVCTADWDTLPDAILVAWQPGQEAGRSIADVLSGAVCPSGKLPMTFARAYADHPSAANFANLGLPFDGKNKSFYHYSDHPIYEQKDVDYQDYAEDLAVGYRHFTTAEVPVSAPFGYGLSYTRFSFEDFSVQQHGRDITISVTVTNTGSCAGKEVAQVYWSNPTIPSAPRTQLLCYAKTPLLQPGQSTRLTLHATQSDLAWFSESESAWRTESEGNVLELRADANTLLFIHPLTFKKALIHPCARVLLPQ